jgi:hypothetical protein
MAQCGACDGSGECHNDFHGFFETVVNSGVESLLGGNRCPACGQDRPCPGKCSACGGTGDVDE